MSKCANYIVSLVGTNPLPSFISILEKASKNTKVFLIHTESNGQAIGTKKVAENLMEVLKEKREGCDVQLIPCDKSDIKKILKVIKNVQTLIQKDNFGYLNKKSVLIDYTSGTKVMSALFYNKFKEAKTDNYKYIFTYIDDNSEKMILEDRDVIQSIFLSDIEKEEKIEIKDISRIYGYSIKNENECIVEKFITESKNTLNYLHHKEGEKVKFINKRKESIKVDAVLLLNYKLCIYEKSKEKESGQKSYYKMELFVLKDKVEKIGGSRSAFYYKCKIKDNELESLKTDIKRSYEFDMDKRVKILNQNSTVEDRIECIKFENQFV